MNKTVYLTFSGQFAGQFVRQAGWGLDFATTWVIHYYSSAPKVESG